jgi:histidine ammonia-lyase
MAKRASKRSTILSTPIGLFKLALIGSGTSAYTFEIMPAKKTMAAAAVQPNIKRRRDFKVVGGISV